MLVVMDIGNRDEIEEMGYCEHSTRSVEIVYRSSEGKETLTQAYFPYDPDLHV